MKPTDRSSGSPPPQAGSSNGPSASASAWTWTRSAATRWPRRCGRFAPAESSSRRSRTAVLRRTADPGRVTAASRGGLALWLFVGVRLREDLQARVRPPAGAFRREGRSPASPRGRVATGS